VTFTLRNDVQFVRWDPVADTAEAVRPVTAADVAYGIKRACDPRLGSYYTSVADKVVLGCNDVSTKPVEEVTEADYDLVQVEALDDTTLVVSLQFAASYFFSMTPMWMFRPVPQEVIAEFGDNWTDVGTIVTTGAFVLDEYVRGVRRVYVKNPLLPADLRGPGNVERVVITIVEDAGTQFALYLDKQIETVGVPAAEVQSVLSDPVYAEQLIQKPEPIVTYFAFAHDKPPFDKVEARRAFGSIVDRDAFNAEIRQNRGVPMIHFTPPGMFGAPPINEVGVGYNPEFAQEQLAAAGYPNCEGFPNIEVISGGGFGEFLSAAAERDLGCNRDLFTLETVDFTVLLELIDPRNEPEERPNMWAIAWGPDYGDARTECALRVREQLQASGTEW
jgi:ABC-type oligopeptide transport system substrate-binding subunit